MLLLLAAPTWLPLFLRFPADSLGRSLCSLQLLPPPKDLLVTVLPLVEVVAVDVELPAVAVAVVPLEVSAAAAASSELFPAASSGRWSALETLRNSPASSPRVSMVVATLDPNSPTFQASPGNGRVISPCSAANVQNNHSQNAFNQQ